MSTNPTDPKIKAEAKGLFLLRVPKKDIAARLGLTESVVHSWIYEGKPSWKKERDEREHYIINEVLETTKPQLMEIISQGSRIIKKAFNDIEMSDKPIKMADAYNAMMIIVNIDKMQRLGDDMPTENVRHTLPTMAEIIDKMKADPLFDPKMLEVRPSRKAIT